MLRKKKILLSMLSLVMAACCTFNFIVLNNTGVSAQKDINIPGITKLNGLIDNDLSAYFDGNVVSALPETVDDEQDISVIVSMSTENIVDSYVSSGTTAAIEDYASGKEAEKLKVKAAAERKNLINKLNKSRIKYTYGETYDNIVSGFEITVKAKYFAEVEQLLNKNNATAIVGEVYEESKYEVVTNEVEVDANTGIFTNTTDGKYTGRGVVVAILDTGLDYTHTAFQSSENTVSGDRFDKSYLRNKLSELSASESYRGLTAEDLFVSRKVPYAFDYADKDPDVFPINSEHGTHVAGIIAGEDSEITGVATDAQLAIMKVFSDSQDGAKTSWLLAALDDCVNLGVDVINMSLGSGCGFTREVDEVNVAEIYDRVKEAGISLIASAANSYNATMGSDKNGNNGLTSNPDSGTVGSPSTYEAALSIASVDGVMTPYILFEDEIMYFKEASTADNVDKDFVTEILTARGELDGTTYDTFDFTYVTIPGYGQSSDYSRDEDYYRGKIALVKRGSTTFEEKVRIALEKGCIGVIIYNNVSGSISMSVGNNMGAVCSLAQDEGEILAAHDEGVIRLSLKQVAGPFMSDFSSWGPTSDLKIKPEITGHGGEIYSAVPGQEYDKLSGTSMAAPNVSGVTALIRQYVKEEVCGPKNEAETEQAYSVRVTDVVNQLMMSTADIIMNKNGLAYSVRKQGAGLVSLTKATTTEAYLVTYDKDGNEMDKTKLEIGDDKEKNGVYEMTFGVKNISNSAVSYNVASIVNTEGISTTYTSHGELTVTQDGYALEGGQNSVQIIAINGQSASGNKVTVAANSTSQVTVRITLSDEDKKYLDQTFGSGTMVFENGMYVEGFIKLEACDGTNVSLSVPFLGFYGDWTQAPIFDEEFYDTNKDELNAGLDDEDKLMADAYATRAIGNLYSDYISTLGSYYFKQNPTATPIPANKDHISVSNQIPKDNQSNYTVNGIRSISAGLLRNVKVAYMTITDDITGEVIWSKQINNQRKSYSSGSSIYASSFDVDFSVLENNLKNNTRYTFKLESYIDYGEESEQNNARNVFEFPFYVDFEAPVITDVTYRSEYDKTTKKTKLYADISVYDNHYAMAMQLGQIKHNDAYDTDPANSALFTLETFGEYFTPMYSSYNSTTKVSVELTDYVQKIKESVGAFYDENGSIQEVKNSNTYIVNVYDYAMNAATYELKLPDEVISMYFYDGIDDTQVLSEIKLSPNETKDISTILKVYPSDTWAQALTYTSSDKDVFDVVNNYIVAKNSGTATLTVTAKDDAGVVTTSNLNVKVLAEGDEGYNRYTVQEVNKFSVTGYETIKAYYSLDSEDRDIGFTGASYEFGGSLKLSMYPSESVKLNCLLESYFPDRTSLEFSAGNKRVEVTSDGVITAKEKGNSSVTVTVKYTNPDTGKVTSTNYSARISITVKEPFKTQSIYLMSYKGLGGTVQIPANKGITTIYQYAFSNYEYVDKDVDAGDVIDKEDPYYIKQMFIGENTITRVEIPEGVTTIEKYAFANLTALESIKLPSTLKTIGVGAFIGCTKLKTVEGLENVKFINKDAFKNNVSLTDLKFGNLVAIGDYAFEGCTFGKLDLPETAQSIGIGSFRNNDGLSYVTFNADKVKVGSYAFANCTKLAKIDINAAVISSHAFEKCTSLKDVTLGKDVQVIGEYAFANTAVASFKINKNNNTFKTEDGGAVITQNVEENGKTIKKLMMVAPSSKNYITTDADVISKGSLSGNVKLNVFVANNATVVEDYAFAGCANLASVVMPNVVEIGQYAFYQTNIAKTPALDKVQVIGAYAFARSGVRNVTIPENVEVSAYAFAYCNQLENVVLGDGCVVDKYAFANEVNLKNTFEYQINKIPYAERTNSRVMKIFSDYYTLYTYNVLDKNDNILESHKYYKYDLKKGGLANSVLTEITVGDGVTLGNYAFYGSVSLNTLNFGSGVSIGSYCFYNAVDLENVDLSEIVKVGNYAFSGDRTLEYLYENGTIGNAYDFKTYDGNDYTEGDAIATGYKYTSFAASIENANLVAITENGLGIGVFQANDTIKTVTISTQVKKISDYTFAYCTSLETINCAEDLSVVGDYAFYGSGISDIDTSVMENIGEYAFARTDIDNVDLKDGVVIGDYAFGYCTELDTINNLGKASVIGASAFRGTEITVADLTSATYVGDFAFAQSKVTKVIFGSDTLEYIGENPFYDCDIETYSKTKNVTFGNATIQQTENTYRISDTVSVYNGVIYKTVPTGMVLVSYPKKAEATDYSVEEGTVRISATAFAGSALSSVTIASTVDAIGDKAFYDCEKLTIVTFLSLNAPILEEEYDTSYLTYQNLPMTGTLSVYEGLGISDYYMWNVTSRYNNFYFGANFVDHIGHVEKKLIMVRPQNGANYNSFIYGQYFDTVMDGQNAATDETLNVISLIAVLDKSITLADEANVVAARKAYDSLSSVQQKALVTNLSILENAESMIDILKSRDSSSSSSGSGSDVEPTDDNSGMVVLFVVLGVCAITAAGVVVSKIIAKKNKNDKVND